MRRTGLYPLSFYAKGLDGRMDQAPVAVNLTATVYAPEATAGIRYTARISLPI